METAARTQTVAGVCEDLPHPAETMLRHAIEASPSGLLAVGPSGKIAMANSAMELQFGYLRGELIGHPIELLLPDSLPAEQRPSYLASAQTCPARILREARGRRKDGTEMSVEITINPVPTTAGQFLLLSAVEIRRRNRLGRGESFMGLFGAKCSTLRAID